MWHEHLCTNCMKVVGKAEGDHCMPGCDYLCIYSCGKPECDAFEKKMREKFEEE